MNTFDTSPDPLHERHRERDVRLMGGCLYGLVSLASVHSPSFYNAHKGGGRQSSAVVMADAILRRSNPLHR
jgi:hypothetical protein